MQARWSVEPFAGVVEEQDRMLPRIENHSRRTKSAAYRESTPVGFTSGGYGSLLRKPSRESRSVSWETPETRDWQTGRFRYTAEGAQFGIRFAADNSSSSEERGMELRQFGRRRTPDIPYAETLGRETGRGILRRRSGSRPASRRFSCSSSDEHGVDEGPRRRQVSLTPPRFEWPDSPWPNDPRSRFNA